MFDMAAVSFNNAMTSGHGPFPPTKAIATATTVRVNGKPILRQGDPTAIHTRMVDPYDSHSSTVSMGSATVRAEGMPVARIGDSIACGGSVAQGSGNVFCG